MSKKAWGMKNKICIVEMIKSQLGIQVQIGQAQIHRNVETTNEIVCDYCSNKNLSPCR